MGSSLTRASIAEAIGTFLFVFAGGAVVCMDRYMASPGISDDRIGIHGIALAHGLALMVAIYAVAARSGAHINPAVTLGLLAIGRVKGGQALSYIIFQLLGAVAAGLAIWAMFPGFREASPHLGTPAFEAAAGMPGAMGIPKAMGIEALLTFFLMTVVLNVAFDSARAARQMFGLAIGFTVVVIVYIGFQYTGAAANPARYFGPAVVSGQVSQLIVYFIGPIVGAVAAAIFYKLFMETKEADAAEVAST